MSYGIDHSSFCLVFMILDMISLFVLNVILLLQRIGKNLLKKLG